MLRRSGGDGVGEWQGELVEKLRVWRREPENHGVRLVVGDDPRREAAVPGDSFAAAGAGDTRIEEGCGTGAVVADEDPLDGAAEVLRLDQVAV